MSWKRVRDLLPYLVIGALVFWVPDIIVHAATGYRFGGLAIVCLTVFLPPLVCIAVALTCKTKRDSESFQSAALSAVLGIWVSGPVMIAVSLSFSGGTFLKPGTWEFTLLSTFLFPMFTFIMSTYDGTLFAVIIVSVALPLMSVVCKEWAQSLPLHHTK